MPKVWDEGEFEARSKQVLDEELQHSLRPFYLSFASPERFLGGAIVEAHGILSAVTMCNALGINPGGEVMALPVPEDHVPSPEYFNRLLSKEEVQNLPPAAQEEKENQYASRNPSP
jgi:hypothetical protein